MLGKTYELTLNKGYVAHWGMREAVRELLQNAIDSDSPFVYEFDREDDGTWTLCLRSEFSQLTPSSLLLGTTSKAESVDTIGQFGEGYKIALLVLTREGYPVAIHNGPVFWSPYFKYNNRFDEELLCIDESPSPMKHKGLTFLVSNLDEADCAAIRDSCVLMQDHIGAIRQTPMGDILLEQPGRLYVGGLLISETTQLRFGYNVRPQYLKLERDRSTVEGWRLGECTRDMWFATQDYTRIAQLISEETKDLELARWSAPDLVKEECYKLFQEQHPGAVAAKDQAELQRLVAAGMTRVVVVPSTFGDMVTGSRSHSSQPRVRVKSPTEKLEDWLNANKYRIHAHAKIGMELLIKESKSWTIR